MTSPFSDILTQSGASEWALQLYDTSLRPIACWGQGKYFPGTDLRQLSDNPPDRQAVASADYRGGLAILLGTKHPLGGFITGGDIDEGPSDFPLPHHCLMLERGTGPGRWHFFLRTPDRLEGQLNLRDAAGKLVAEVKGRGYALRSWPTRPEGKPGGYSPVYVADDPATAPPSLMARQVADATADYLTRVLGRAVHVEGGNCPRLRSRHTASLPGWVSLVYQAICDCLEAAGHRLRPSSNGGLFTTCPLHDDHNPSLSIHPSRGWKCFGGCGEGRLTLLAARLGIWVPEEIHR